MYVYICLIVLQGFYVTWIWFQFHHLAKTYNINITNKHYEFTLDCWRGWGPNLEISNLSRTNASASSPWSNGYWSNVQYWNYWSCWYLSKWWTWARPLNWEYWMRMQNMTNNEGILDLLFLMNSFAEYLTWEIIRNICKLTNN